MKRCRALLGTYVEITVSDEDQNKATSSAAIEHAFAAIARVGTLMSFHDTDSDLSRLNAMKPGHDMTVDPWTFEVLQLAQDLHASTQGGFDCGVGGLLVRWGLLPSHDNTAADNASHRSSIADVELLDNCRVRVTQTVCLDLGGIAKGFAVDRAVDALVRSGVREAIVNAGGDLRVLGDTPQPIHVRLPSAPQQLVCLGMLADGAMATSAPYFSAAYSGALVDPFAGTVLTAPTSYTVLAPSCAVADGLTKALAVAGQLSPACLQRYSATALPIA
jgi:thiamine biosynthesis lipoprotein